MKLTLEELTSFAKRRGFVYPSSEIYGSLAGVYDYGPLGALLARNIRTMWWKRMVEQHPQIVGLDSSILMDSRVWEASGHTKGFSDPVITHKKKNIQHRVDHLLEDIDVEVPADATKESLQSLLEENKETLKEKGVSISEYTEVDFCNLLVSSYFGSNLKKEEIYLRGETAQGIYVNYKQVVDTMPVKIPFGIAQIGKAFRNEISPRQFLFRTREFEQMEMQFFTHPDDTQSWYDYFIKERVSWLEQLGIAKDSLRITPHANLVFYAKAAVDIEYNYPFGWRELEGIHNRGDYDLTQHQTHSKTSLSYTDEEKGKFIPNVVETSIGVGRLFLAILHNAYEKETLPDNTERVVLRVPASIAPYPIAVLPLMKKDPLIEKAKDVHKTLSDKYHVAYDETQSIGKRYRRQDEIGTPLCITIDFDTLEDNAVTIRNRDTMKQDRVPIAEIEGYCQKHLV